MELRKQASAEITNAVIEFADSAEFEKGQQRFGELMMRSATDLDFRSRLLTNPHEALEEFYGHELPPETRALNIRFVENQGDATLVLPDPILLDHELSEEELEAVAGGNPAISAAVSATGSPASAVMSAIVSGTLALGAVWLAKRS